MKTILVVDDLAVFREPIAASLRLAGYQTATACDGEDALAKARLSRPDLILLDAAMPKMNGMTFLKHKNEDANLANVPVLLLTAVTDERVMKAATMLGVSDYLLKSRFRLPDLLERVQKNLETPSSRPIPDASRVLDENGPSSSVKSSSSGTSIAKPATIAPQAKLPKEQPTQATTSVRTAAGTNYVSGTEIPSLMTREKCTERAQVAIKAKTLSGVVSQVISAATSAKTDNVELASLILQDPMMSARLLQAANSAALASSSGIVTTIEGAIKKVGCAGVRNIAETSEIFDTLPESSSEGFNPIRCWQHSLAVAQICETLTAGKSPEISGLAYIVGLCHDLGDMLIRSHFSAEYSQIDEFSLNSKLPRDRVQREMLGLSHIELMRIVFDCIGLPEPIREPIEALHGPSRASSKNPLVQVLWMAENYANAVLLASAHTSTIAPMTTATCQAAVGDANPKCPDARTLRADVSCVTVSLAGLSRSDGDQLIVPLFPSTTARIWLARDPGLSTFDPIITALQSICSVHSPGRLPTAQEVGKIDAIVVACRPGEIAGFTAKDIQELNTSFVNQGVQPLPICRIMCEPLIVPATTSPTPPTAIPAAETPSQTTIPVHSGISLATLADFVQSAAQNCKQKKVA